MLEVGQIFNKNNATYCVLDLIDYDGKNYVLFSKESDKIAYIFYEILETIDGYNLVEVDDEKINFALLDIFERKED